MFCLFFEKTAAAIRIPPKIKGFVPNREFYQTKAKELAKKTRLPLSEIERAQHMHLERIAPFHPVPLGKDVGKITSPEHFNAISRVKELEMAAQKTGKSKTNLKNISYEQRKQRKAMNLGMREPTKNIIQHGETNIIPPKTGLQGFPSPIAIYQQDVASAPEAKSVYQRAKEKIQGMFPSSSKKVTHPTPAPMPRETAVLPEQDMTRNFTEKQRFTAEQQANIMKGNPTVKKNIHTSSTPPEPSPERGTVFRKARAIMKKYPIMSVGVPAAAAGYAAGAFLNSEEPQPPMLGY